MKRMAEMKRTNAEELFPRMHDARNLVFCLERHLGARVALYGGRLAGTLHPYI